MQYHRESGFVLVTGLIFLVLMTLLAVSSLSSNTLQERISSNFRERSQAQDAAEAALRDGEYLLQLQDTAPVATNDPLDAFWPTGALTGGDPTNTAPFLNADNWSQDNSVVPQALQARVYGEDTALDDLPNRAGGVDDLPAPQYFIEDFAFNTASSDLSPDSQAQGIGAYMYRVTARAQGGNPSSAVVLQSYYQKRFK